MARTSKVHFSIFRKAVLRSIKEFQITGWTVEIHHVALSGAAAQITPQMDGRRADITLNTEWTDEITRDRLEEKARHEVIHLLLARLSGLAAKRHVTEGELYEAEEELVAKLLAIVKPAPRPALRKAKTKKIQPVADLVTVQSQ